MIIAVFISMYTFLIWGMVANTEIGWISWILSLIIIVCQAIALAKYEQLLQRIENLERGGKKK